MEKCELFLQHLRTPREIRTEVEQPDLYGTSKSTEAEQTEAVQDTLEEGQNAKKSRNEESEVLEDNLTRESVNQVQFGNMGFIRYHDDTEMQSEIAPNESETRDVSRENNIVQNVEEEEAGRVSVASLPVVDTQDNHDRSVEDENVANKDKK